MTAGDLSSDTTGWIAITTGIAAVAALLFLVLLYTVGQPFGTLNDVFNGLIGILSAILAWRLYSVHPPGAPFLSQAALLLAGVGGVVTVIGSALVVSNKTGWVLAGWYTGAGNSLIGLWLAAFCFSTLRSAVLPHNLVVFGLITGICLAAGLLSIGGIIGRIDSMDSLPGYLYLAWVGFLGVYILYPIWAIWLGRILRAG